MKTVFLFFVYFFHIYACSDSISSKFEPLSIKLEADKTEGISPLEVNFTATLSGSNIDTIKCYYPPGVLCYAGGKPCIYFTFSDSVVYAKRKYNVKSTYRNSSDYPRTFLAYYSLMAKSGVVHSDTLEITVTKN